MELHHPLESFSPQLDIVVTTTRNHCTWDHPVLNDTDFLCPGTGEGHTSAHANFEDNPPTTAGLRREHVFHYSRDHANCVMMNEGGGGLI